MTELEHAAASPAYDDQQAVMVADAAIVDAVRLAVDARSGDPCEHWGRMAAWSEEEPQRLVTAAAVLAAMVDVNTPVDELLAWADGQHPGINPFHSSPLCSGATDWPHGGSELMAREHARLLCRIWSDPDFRARSSAAQRMYMLVMSQRGLNHAGVIAMTVQRWASCAPDTAAEDVNAALAELAEHGYVVYDQSTEELLVRSYMRNDGVAKQPNVLKAALRQALTVDSPRLRAALAKELRKIGGDAVLAVADELDPKGSGSHPEPPSNPSGILPVEPQAKGSPNPSPQTRGIGEGVSSNSPHSPSVDGSSRRRAAKRGTRVPEDFAPTEDMIAWAKENTPLVGWAENARFVDHWLSASGANASKRDWNAAWRNWMRKAQEMAEDRAARAAPRPAASPLLSTTDRKIAEAERLKDNPDPRILALLDADDLARNGGRPPDARQQLQLVQGGA